MSLQKAVKNLKFDKRLTEWSLSNGQLTEEEYKKFLESLPDVSGNIQTESLDEEEADTSAMDEEDVDIDIEAAH